MRSPEILVDSKDIKYFKSWVDRLDKRTFLTSGFNEEVNFDQSEFRRKRANYDLYNGIVNLDDFLHVFSGTGLTHDNIPARLTNRDIVSTKIKAVMGLDLERPFEYRVAAVNKEATTKAEQVQFDMLKDFVYQETMAEIEQEVMGNAEQTEEGMAQAQQQIEQMTPDKIHRYMARKYQDPAEVHAQQLIEYLSERERVEDKFRKGLKHACLSAYEVYYLYEKNGHPTVDVVNPIFFRFDMSPDLDYIEDAEWAMAEYRFTPSEIIRRWGKELTKEQQKKIYDYYGHGGAYAGDPNYWWQYEDEREGLRAVHCVWRGVRKIGYLTYKDEFGEEQEMLVPQGYKLNKKRGDIRVEWDYIPEVHEGWKILDDIYVGLRVMPNQHKDPDNLYDVKLPYFGAVYDFENSVPTSLMDRMREYQYLNNIVWYRIEMLMAADKGKKAFLNLNAVPRSKEMSLEQFEYYLEVNQLGYLDLNQEGNKFLGNIGEVVKEVDLSGGGNIEKYMNLSEYLDRKAGEVIGVPKELEGQIHQRAAVKNVQQTMYTASAILEDFFKKRSQVKRNVLQGLLELAKVTYRENEIDALTYVTDDMTKKMLTLDIGLLDSMTLGIFISDSREAQETKEVLKELSHAAMQTGQISMSAVVKVYRAKGLQEGEEELEMAENKMRQIQQQEAERQRQHEQMMEEMKMQEMQMQHEFKMKEIELKERWAHDTAIKRQALLSMGFADDKDMDNNNVPDVVQVMKLLLEEKPLSKATEVDAEGGAIEDGMDEQPFS